METSTGSRYRKFFHQGVNNIFKKVKIKFSILNQVLVGTKSFLGNKISN